MALTSGVKVNAVMVHVLLMVVVPARTYYVDNTVVIGKQKLA